MELTIEQALQQGLAAHKQGNLQEAERLYASILKSQPAHADANHSLGVIAVSVNKVELALPLFKTALEANPKIEQFWLSYIDALIKETQIETAKNVLTEGKKVGLVGDKAEALEAQLKQITQLALPKLPEKQKRLTLKERRRKINESKQQKRQARFKSANGISPSRSELNNLLGHYQNGRHGEAEKLAVSITQQFPKHQFGWKVLGAVLGQTGRESEAINANQKAVELSPQDADARYNLGIALKKLGRLEEAEESYRLAIVLKPNYPAAHSNLGNTLQELGRLEEAEASYTQAIALKSDFSDAHYNLGNTLKMLGRLEKAEASYRKAIVLTPDYADSHYNLGITLQELGRLEEAEASYRRAIALQPDYAEAYSNLGVALKELGRLDEAEVSYRQAIVLKPDYPEAHSNLGNTLQELGRLDEAESSYRQAIACKPDYTDAFMNRWRLLFNKGDFEAALKDSEFCNTKVSRQHSLETLYALRRIEEVYKRIEMESQVDEGNITTAAFASFLAKIEKKDTANNFCKNPIDFIHFDNISSHLEDSNALITELIEELHDLKTVWEPTQKATKKGFQTPIHINLFGDPSLKMAHLKSIILDELDSYYLRFQNELCSFIQKWPCKKNLWGWHVILKHQGYQTAHIHPGGWLSGVIYLKVVPSLGEDEGAIEFSLNGENYSNVNSPSLTYQPKKGDIVFFPSSLHHRTIPFTTDTDRIIVSFDLIPDKLGGLI